MYISNTFFALCSFTLYKTCSRPLPKIRRIDGRKIPSPGRMIVGEEIPDSQDIPTDPYRVSEIFVKTSTKPTTKETPFLLGCRSKGGTKKNNSRNTGSYLLAHTINVWYIHTYMDGAISWEMKVHIPVPWMLWVGILQGFSTWNTKKHQPPLTDHPEKPQWIFVWGPFWPWIKAKSWKPIFRSLGTICGFVSETFRNHILGIQDQLLGGPSQLVSG